MSDNLPTTMAIGYSLLLADKYSVIGGCDSFMTRFWWFTTRPRSQHKWERGQRCTRPRTRPRPDTTRPSRGKKNLALRPCWPRGLNIPAYRWLHIWYSEKKPGQVDILSAVFFITVPTKGQCTNVVLSIIRINVRGNWTSILSVK